MEILLGILALIGGVFVLAVLIYVAIGVAVMIRWK